MANSAQSNEPWLRSLFLNRRTIISAVLLVCVILLITSNRFWRWMYPIGYQTTIQQAAASVAVDPLLIASVIRVESKFRSEDVSHAGAIGLMQLMPDTARWIAGKIATTGTPDASTAPLSTERDLAQPNVNIQLGSWYLHYLVQLFHGNQVAAIAAYNAGPKRVQTWLRAGTWSGKLGQLDDIPVGETRHFVDRVFYNYDLYKRIYGNDADWQR